MKNKIIIVIGAILICLNILIIFILLNLNFETNDKMDINNDGKVNAQDYVEIKNYIISENINYDINSDGSVDSMDLLLLRKYLIDEE